MTRFEGIETVTISSVVITIILNWNNDPIWGDWDIITPFKRSTISNKIETMTRFEGIETIAPSNFFNSHWFIYWNNDPIWGDWDFKNYYIFFHLSLHWNNDPIWGDWDPILLKFYSSQYSIETMTRFEGIETEFKVFIPFYFVNWNNDPIWGDWDPP